ncbi:hypothetical protein NDN08_001601 [Rhodosorus marinus]|uniref:Polynucleotide 5'-hydroxyl-kinase NOL9 n=1 Tax=Rhodosorus marinus TaxID=101924 RepID=A0AAV8UR88_9RHOD|nr:hypothetical protein NDN08_001601 [Rhodosorus marinus]
MEKDYTMDSILRVQQDQEESGTSRGDGVLPAGGQYEPSEHAISDAGGLEKAERKEHDLISYVLETVDSGTCIVQIPTSRVVTLAGQCVIEILEGTIRICGLCMVASPKKYRVYSYPWTQYLVQIESLDSSAYGELRKEEDSRAMNSKNAQTLDGSVLRVSSLRVRAPDRITAIPNSIEAVPGLFLLKPQGDHGKGLPPYLEIWNEWEHLLHEIREAGKDSRIIIVGSRGGGKSTLARCLGNYVVEQFGKALYLETDLGQPDKAPPGMLSLLELRGVEYGSPMSPLDESSAAVVKSLFIGLTSPSGDPDAYSAASVTLARYARTSAQGTPLIVNTHGWFKGMGLDFVSSIVKSVDPTIVVYMERNQNPVGSSEMPEKLVKDLNQDTCTVLRVTSAKTSHPDRSGRHLREDRIASYFGKESPTYCVPYKSVKTFFIDAEVPESQKFVALNGSLVALCQSDPAEPRPQIWPCLGLGIVRAVSPEDEMLFICASISADLLRSVDALVLSRFIQIPTATMQRYGEQGKLPYQADDVVSLMSATMQGRGGALKRKRLSEP